MKMSGTKRTFTLVSPSRPNQQDSLSSMSKYVLGSKHNGCSHLQSAYPLLDQSDICDIVQAIYITTSDKHAEMFFMSSADAQTTF